ncbi:hypothetical protein ACTA71_008299 [Dictyostelium dimigraforme]
MYNFNTVEKVLKSIGKPQSSKITPLPLKSPYCMGACCQMITSTSHIPSVVLKNHNSILPFVKEECPHYLQNKIKLYSSHPTMTTKPPTSSSSSTEGISQHCSLYKNKLFNNNNNFIPANRLYTTSINNYKIFPYKDRNNNDNNNSNTLSNSNNTIFNNNKNKTKVLFKNPDNPFLYKNRNESTKSSSQNQQKLEQQQQQQQQRQQQQQQQQQLLQQEQEFYNGVEKEQSHFELPNACSISDHSLIVEPSENYKNCVRFETPKSSYVHELIEGILPKELVSGSRMITPSEPHCIYVNFTSAVKAYQADQYVRQWSEKNLPSLKSMLLRQSLDTFFPYETSKIEKVNNTSNDITSNFTSNILSQSNQFQFENQNDPYINFPEYPIPQFKLINNKQECDKLVTELLLNGKSINSISNQDDMVFSFDLQYKHVGNKPNTVHFYVLTLSNGDNNLIFNLDSLNGVPKIVSKIFNSPTIKKIGYPHRRYKVTDFINLLGWNVNNFENLSTNKIISNSHSKGLTSVVATFLNLKLPKVEIDRFTHSNTEDNYLFTQSKQQHYAQITDCILSLYHTVNHYNYTSHI